MSDRDQANYSQIALICIICRKRGPSGETEPEGWALWTRTPPTYFLHTCPKHSTHEGLWAPVEPPVLSRAAVLKIAESIPVVKEYQWFRDVFIRELSDRLESLISAPREPEE